MPQHENHCNTAAIFVEGPIVAMVRRRKVSDHLRRNYSRAVSYHEIMIQRAGPTKAPRKRLSVVRECLSMPFPLLSIPSAIDLAVHIMARSMKLTRQAALWTCFATAMTMRSPRYWLTGRTSLGRSGGMSKWRASGEEKMD